MKKITLLLILLSLNATSQSKKLKEVDKIIDSYSKTTSIEALAKKIDHDFKSDIEKTRAVFSWVASNVRYKTKNPYEITSPKVYVVTDENDLKRRLQEEDRKIISKVFNSKRAVCKGYALLFKELCDLLKIENEIILGYIKNSPNQIDFIPKQKNHAWNAVKINDQWIFIDVTYGAGYATNNVWRQKFNSNYFNIDKEVIKNTHYAKEPFWQKHVNQPTLREFCTQPLYSNAAFSKTFEVLSPRSGKIRIDKKRSDLELKIRGIDHTIKIQYRFGKNGRLRSPLIKHNDSISILRFRKSRKKSNLKIYFNNELALEYLLVSRD
ncbi:MAG: hypothetical protein JXR05_06330 [Flavobacteriaceae bacterium]